MSEKLCGYRHLTDKRLENEKFKVSVKCLFYLLWIGHLTYRSYVYRPDGVTPVGTMFECFRNNNLLRFICVAKRRVSLWSSSMYVYLCVCLCFSVVFILMGRGECYQLFQKGKPPEMRKGKIPLQAKGEKLVLFAINLI